MIGIGVWIVWKSDLLLEWFGRIDFFEQKLGAEGGTRLGYKLIGIAVIFLGMLELTNMFGGFMRWILSPLIRNNTGV